jgi:hypothetical protein
VALKYAIIAELKCNILIKRIDENAKVQQENKEIFGES